eukprot:763932-Hanusia_phi.AAC.11
MLRREERRMLESLSMRWNLEEEKFLIKRRAPPPLPLTRSESLQRSSGPILKLRERQAAAQGAEEGAGSGRPSVLSEYMAFAKSRMEKHRTSAPVRPFPSLLAEQSAIEFMQTSQWREARKNPYADVEDAVGRKKSRWRTRRVVNMELKQKFAKLPYIDQDNAHIVTRKARRLRLAMSEFGMLQKATMIQEGMMSANNLAGGKTKNEMVKSMSTMLYNAHAAWKKMQVKEHREERRGGGESEAPMRPNARRGHSLTLIDASYALLIGGSSGRGSTYCSTMLKLNLVDFCWEKVGSFGTKPPARSYHSAVLSDQIKVIVFGGMGKQGNLSDCYELNVLEMRWSILFQSGDVRPSARHGHTMTQTMQGEIAVLFGGAGAGFFNDLFLFDCRTGRWTVPEQHGSPPAPRAFHSTCALDRSSRMFIFGGQNGSANFNDLYDFNMETLTWSFVQTSGILPSPRWGHSAVVQGMDTMIVFGGAGDQFFDDVFLFSRFGSSWKFAHGPGEAPAGRWGHSSFLHGESAAMYVYGGHSQTAHLVQEDAGRVGVPGNRSLVDLSWRQAASRLDEDACRQREQMVREIASSVGSEEQEWEKEREQERMQVGRDAWIQHHLEHYDFMERSEFHRMSSIVSSTCRFM